MEDSADQEGDEHGDGLREVGSSREVNVTEEEVVNGDVPFSREFQPVTRVPPVRVEVSVRELGKFCECPQDVFEDDKED